MCRAVCCWLLMATMPSVAISSSLEIRDLADEGWQLYNANGSLKMPVTLPTYTLQALQEQGHISDPLFRCCSASVMTTPALRLQYPQPC